MIEGLIETDVLIIGGGGAGFRAAIGACEKGVKVTLVSKGPLARCGASPMAGADFTLDGQSLSKFEGMVGDPNDTPEKVFNDIVTQGFYLNNQKLVEQYIREAPQCLEELLNWGIKVILSDERAVITSGLGLMDVLLKKARHMGVEFLQDVAILDLVTEGEKVVGALGLDIRSGQFVRFSSKAVIVATGGWHKAFWPNTGMRDLSGDGIAMAQRAGALLGNMEFITFACNVFYEPAIWRGSISPYVIGIFYGGRLTNNLGEEFMKGYDPFMVEKGTFSEWNKIVTSWACTKEVREGRGFPGGAVHFTRGNIDWEDIEKVAALVFPNWKYKGLDLAPWAQMLKNNEPSLVGPAAEYFDGGIIIDERFETSIPGLFAAGECTLGPFGANRVFSAITEMLVHGAAAGANAADYALKTKRDKAAEDLFKDLEETADRPFQRRDGVKVARVKRELQEAAHKSLGPIRTREGLESFLSLVKLARADALSNLSVTAKSRTYNKEWLECLELKNMTQLLETSAKCALARTESRGVHFREDYPDTDNNHWVQETVVKMENGDFDISYRPVTVTSMTPPEGTTPYLASVKQMMANRSDTGGKH